MNYQKYTIKQHIYFNIFVLIVLTCYAMSGCSTMEKIGVYIDENAVLVNFATSEAITFYCENGDTIEDKRHRAEGVQRVSNQVLSFITDNPETTVDELVKFVNSVIPWSKPSPHSRDLVNEIIPMIERNLRKNENINGKTLLPVRSIFNSAIKAAGYYL